MATTRRAAATVSGAPEIVAVVVAAAAGLVVQSPLRWMDRHDAVDIALVVLVVASAVTIAPAGWRGVGDAWRLAVGALLAGVTVLPAVVWVVAHLVASGPLRDGVLTVGLAPCEIASVATTTIAGGDAALAAAVLVGSTVLSAVAAGPILSLEAGGASVPTGHVVTNLLEVVVLPLLAGLVLRARLPALARGSSVAAAGWVAATSVAVLVALVAAQVHLSSRYLPVAAALAAIVALSALGGWALGRGRHPDRATAVLLTVSMRDFAIAAGLATAAFGAAAAAPLGLYGIMVLGWGTAAASHQRRRRARGAGSPPSR